MTKMQEFKELNKAKGQHFFSEENMRSFKSQIESSMLHGKYFVTSEQFWGTTKTDPRMYTIREANWETGGVNKVGEFQQFKSLDDAIEYIEHLDVENV